MIDSNYKNRANEIAATVAVTIDTANVERLRDDVMDVYKNTKNKVGSEKWGTKAFNKYVGRFKHLEKSHEYKSLYKQVKNIQDENDVDCIYISWIDVPTKGFLYTLDAAEEDPCPIGCLDPIFDQNKAILKNLERGFPAYITDTEEYGWLVTAGAPIHNAKGQVIGFAMVDISMEAIRDRHQTFLMWLIGLEVFLTLVIGALALLFVNRSVVRPINQLSSAAQKYSDEDYHVVHSNFSALEVHTGDEIEALSKSMKKMESDINDNIANLMRVSSELSETRIQAENLNILAKKDALTGIRNKLAYNEDIQELQNELNKKSFKFGIAVVDLDGLKQINDTYGHEKGDISIVALSDLICTVFAHSPVFRIGGDEFVVILRNHDYNHIHELIDEFNGLMADMEANPELEPWEKIHASLGYALYNPETDMNAESVFHRADQTMYSWKRAAHKANPDLDRD